MWIFSFFPVSIIKNEAMPVWTAVLYVVSAITLILLVVILLHNERWVISLIMIFFSCSLFFLYIRCPLLYFFIFLIVFLSWTWLFILYHNHIKTPISYFLHYKSLFRVGIMVDSLCIWCIHLHPTEARCLQTLLLNIFSWLSNFE